MSGAAQQGVEADEAWSTSELRSLTPGWTDLAASEGNDTIASVSNCPMMTLRALVLLGVLVIPSCAVDEPLPPVQAAEPRDVSLVQLIANPSEFHRKVVRVIGFCRLEFEGNALYLHREDFERGIAKNAVWLRLGWPVPESRRPLSDEYVLVEATFDAEAKGHMGSFSGELVDITRMERWPPRLEFERDQRLRPRQ